MGDKTKIEWADASWNPITGCTPISEGCANCYAKRMATRLAGRCGYSVEAPFRVTDHPDKLDVPRQWKRHRRVFVCSMGDLFHEGVSDRGLARVLDACADCPQHVFMLLTKRPERMARVFRPGTVRALPNVWLGVTAENQARLDERVPWLLKTTASVRFASFEPLLGPVDFSNFDPGYGMNSWNMLGGSGFVDGIGEVEKMPFGCLSWVIVGAETGPGKRPMNLDWARSIRDQCVEAGVPFFFKKDSNGNHELDGRVHEEFPGVRS